MSDATIPTDLRHSMTLTVDDGLTVPAFGPPFDFHEMPPVFATGFMVVFIEATCIEALRPHLGPHQRTVGTAIDVSHLAATPIGMRVTAEVELIAVEGRRLRFKVECRDEVETIGEGYHERAIIDLARFLARVEAKAEPAA